MKKIPPLMLAEEAMKGVIVDALTFYKTGLEMGLDPITPAKADAAPLTAKIVNSMITVVRGSQIYLRHSAND